MSIRLAIADDHELIRAGIRSLVAGTDITVACEASSAEELLKLLPEVNPSVVLLDVRFGNSDGDGLQALGRLKASHPDIPAVIFSAYDNPNLVARAVALQASGYLIKSATRAQVLEAIHRAVEGDGTWTREELRRVTGALATPRYSANIEAPLTQRESEVLRQLALGLTNKQIGELLNISYETVKEHVQHILHKIGVADRTQAAIWAVRSGMA